MKYFNVIIALLLSNIILFANENPVGQLQNASNPNLSTSKWTLGASTLYTEVNDLSAGMLGFNAGYRINENFEFGLKGKALYYDRKLNDLDPERSYHLQNGHIGFYVDWHPLGTGDYHFSIPFYMGTGEASYIYDREYSENMVWTEKTIDKSSYAVYELGLEFEARLWYSFSVAAMVNYRATSPIQLLGTSSDIFNQYEVGFTFKYNLFN